MSALVAVIVALVFCWIHVLVFWKLWRSSMGRWGRRARLYVTGHCFMAGMAFFAKALATTVEAPSPPGWAMVMVAIGGGLALSEGSVWMCEIL